MTLNANPNYFCGTSKKTSSYALGKAGDNKLYSLFMHVLHFALYCVCILKLLVLRVMYTLTFWRLTFSYFHNKIVLYFKELMSLSL